MYFFIKPLIRVHMLTDDPLYTFDRDMQEHAMKHLKKHEEGDIHPETFVN